MMRGWIALTVVAAWAAWSVYSVRKEDRERKKYEQLLGGDYPPELKKTSGVGTYLFCTGAGILTVPFILLLLHGCRAWWVCLICVALAFILWHTGFQYDQARVQNYYQREQKQEQVEGVSMKKPRKYWILGFVAAVVFAYILGFNIGQSSTPDDIYRVDIPLDRPLADPTVISHLFQCHARLYCLVARHKPPIPISEIDAAVPQMQDALYELAQAKKMLAREHQGGLKNY